VRDHIQRLRFRDGVLISARLGAGNTGRGYTLLKRAPRRRGLAGRIFGDARPSYSYRIPERDEAGGKALAELRVRGINLVANALAQSTDHIQSFLVRLREELAFYVGCLNVHDELTRIGAPTCFPTAEEQDRPEFSSTGLYDVGLSLNTGRPVIGNDLRADGKPLVMITGANQGGKSTFLRSVGLAQLMMQCGMFVPAESFRASVRTGLFTHYKREEDASMTSGKFDEELGRMSRLAEGLRPGALILFNESFAATNEREGSEIARGIIRALLESGVRVFFVTHQFELADGFYRQDAQHTLFLRAQRLADGRRTFRLEEEAPLPTSFGRDLYAQIFEEARSAAAV
jgi:DNA mismatch repair ATPase MutS